MYKKKICCVDPIIIIKHKQLQSWINMNKKGLILCDDDKIKNNLIEGIKSMNIKKENLLTSLDYISVILLS